MVSEPGYSLVLCDFGLTAWSFSYVDHRYDQGLCGVSYLRWHGLPYWKNKMRMHLEAIDNDLWYVVENGVPLVTPSLNAADVKIFKQLDSQAKNIIFGHLSKGQYGRVSALETAKLIWDRLSKVNEGVSTQRDSRVDVLCNLFNRFKRLDNENV